MYKPSCTTNCRSNLNVPESTSTSYQPTSGEEDGGDTNDTNNNSASQNGAPLQSRRPSSVQESNTKIVSDQLSTTRASRLGGNSNSHINNNYQQNSQQLSPALLAPHFFLPGPAGSIAPSSILSALNGTSGHFLPPFVHHHGASQFASLTPDARACVTATYLCVLIVNNAWLDCNLLDTLCNTNSSTHSRTNGRPYSSSSTTNDRHQQREDAGGGGDSILRDARNATDWLTNGKRNEFTAEGALESALSGLIAFAGGSAEGGQGGEKSQQKDDRKPLATGQAHQFVPITLTNPQPSDGSSEQQHRVYLLPVDFTQSLEPDRREVRAQVLPHDPGGGGSGDFGVSPSTALYLTREEQPDELPLQKFQRIQPQPDKMMLVDDEESKNRILEQYSKLKKSQEADKLYNQHQRQQASSDSADIAADSYQHSSTESSTSPMTSATMTTPSTTTAIPMSLVSWVGRPFRGWSSYSFWSTGSSAESGQQQESKKPQEPIEMPALIADASSSNGPSLSGIQILRPIDRSEYNDIMTSNHRSQSNMKLMPHGANSIMLQQDQVKLDHDHRHGSSSDYTNPPEVSTTAINNNKNNIQPLTSTMPNNVLFGSSFGTNGDFSLPPNAATATPFMSTSPSTIVGIYDLNTDHHQQQRKNQMMQEQHRNRQQHQHLCNNCELTSDPSECQLQCSGSTVGRMSASSGIVTQSMMMTSMKPPSIMMTIANDEHQQQMTTSSTFATPISSTLPTSSSTASLIGLPTTTSSTTSLAPTGKMNPLDVTFLLYTRYHRDLVQELVHLANTKHGSNLNSGLTPSSATASNLASSSGTSQNPTDSLVSVSDIIDLTNETSLSESRLNSSLPIKIIIHGFGSGGRRPWVTDMVYKLLDYEDVNVIVVDWEKGAALPNYVHAAGNTRIVGHKIASLIKSINSKYGLTGNRYHLIGFSLGAHVAGFAGMEIRNSTSIARHWINRITGLDPASPLFEGYEANDRLDPSDAQFVDVIHSNGDGVLRGGFGSLQPMGHVDFYPNGGRVQVGCNSVILSALSDIIYGKWQSLCNHRRALNFFMDSFEFSKCRFRSFNCDSYESYLKGECFDCGQNNEKCSYMGYLANYSKGRGKMYLTTHEDAPFCANQFIIKIVGSKGYKTHWGKVEVTLVTLDGKNESFWLSSSITNSAHATTSSASTYSASSLSGQSSSSAHELSVSGLNAGGSPNNGGQGPSSNQKELNQQSMQSLIVAHPTLVNFTQIFLRYTKYKGWIYSGDESWPIDKVFITDSDGQVKSFCGYNTVLESHITTRLNLEPGNCSVIEQPNSSVNNNANSAATINQQSRISLSNGGGVVLSGGGLPSVGQQQSPGQTQQAVQQQQSLSTSQQQQQQQQQIQQSNQQSSRTPRLLASIMQSAVGAVDHQNSQASLLHGQSVVAMQRMLTPQQLNLATGGGIGGGGMHLSQPHSILAF